MVKISLGQLRYIVINLLEEFKQKRLHPGDTVLLVDMLVNNVCNTSVIFTALAAYGCRVLLPMWIETKEIENWIELAHIKAIIAPGKEINNNKKQTREKEIVKKLFEIATNNKVKYYDIEEFNIKQYLSDSTVYHHKSGINELVEKCINGTDPTTEMVIFTTSGTSGRSKLVVYDQQAYINTIRSYDSTGLYSKGKMLGRTYIDIFPHSVSIRSLINALWTGNPICVLTADWIKNKPEKILPLLTKMKPEVIILGPSSFGLIMDYIKIFPEIKKMIFSELKSIISTGSSYSYAVADEWKKQTSLLLHNAYGLIETQQITSTILKSHIDHTNPSIGKPFAGVELGLKKFKEETYRLYVSTIFGHKYIIHPKTKDNLYPETYFYTGDIVTIDKKQNVYFFGRENLDFVKNGYGAKIPLVSMKEYYHTLYNYVEHICYYPSDMISMNLGITALIFVKESNIPSGRITDKNVIKRYKKIISDCNHDLLKMLEPFEYENRAINRFLLINNNPPKTRKNTISTNRVETEYDIEITDLRNCNLKKTGVVNLLNLNQKLLLIMIKGLSMINPFLKNIFLKIFN